MTRPTMPVASYPGGMSAMLHVPDGLAARLAAEARRRGVDVDALSAELLSAGLTGGDGLEAFIGIGALRAP